MKSIGLQLNESQIPYPQRHALALEIQADLENSDEAIVLEAEDLTELEEIHSTAVFKAMRNLGSARKFTETLIVYFPLILVCSILTKEDSMMNFIKDGGFGMYAILAVGLFLLGRELRHSFRLIVVKDHTSLNLRMDTQTVLLGCLALMLLGLGWSLFGVYVSINYTLANESSKQIAATGIKESMAPVILSTLLSSIVVLAHYATRRVLYIWSAPLA